jgi:O-antigen/teichoic acid export membrane protein
MTEQQSSYLQIIKSTTIFGGVQVFNIFISIIRSKIIAVLLGPAGMGIAGLLTSTTGLIDSLSNLGLNTSAVKNVAAAHASGNPFRIGTVVGVLRRLVWITGILGSLITFFLAPWLSNLTFGNTDYSIGFRWISITILFTQISSGRLVILQGMRKIQYLAKANIAGTTSGLLISLPVYYIWRLEGIVPAIIITSFLTLLFSWYFASKVKLEFIKLNKSSFLLEGSELLRMGFMLSLSSIISLSAAYVVRIFISHKGGVDQVGLFNAGFAIINTYVGMIFTAMGTDYFPRLSEIINDKLKAKNLVNNQAEIAILLLAPILTIFLVFINWVVILFYSTKFIEVDNLIHWAALGMFFKAASWPIAYMFIAKGHTKVFLINELCANTYVLGFNLAGYNYGGLTGLGISFLISYFFYFIQVYLFARNRYTFSFNKEFFKIFIIQFLIGSLCFLNVKVVRAPYFYIVGCLFILLSGYYSLKELNKRLGLITRIETTFFRNNTLR